MHIAFYVIVNNTENVWKCIQQSGTFALAIVNIYAFNIALYLYYWLI